MLCLSPFKYSPGSLSMKGGKRSDQIEKGKKNQPNPSIASSRDYLRTQDYRSVPDQSLGSANDDIRSSSLFGTS